MKKLLTIFLFVLIITMVVPAVRAVQDDFEFEGDVYVASSDTKVTGLPMPEPEPPKPVAPEPPVIMPPDGVPRPDPKPEPEPIVIVAERVLPCPPEPIKDPSKGIRIEPNDDPGPGPDANVTFPEPTPPAWESEEEVIVGMPPPEEPKMWSNQELTVFCELDNGVITVWTDGIESPRLFVFDMTSCRAEVLEPSGDGVYPTFRLEKPRGRLLFLAVFDSNGVIFKITI